VLLRAHTYTHARTRTHTYLHTHTRTRTHTYIHTHTRTRTHTYIQVLEWRNRGQKTFDDTALAKDIRNPNAKKVCVRECASA